MRWSSGMCGIIGFVDRRVGTGAGDATGRVVLEMLRALACRGPDSAGVALLGDEPDEPDGGWTVRVAPGEAPALDRLEPLGRVVALEPADRGGSLRFRF